MKKLMIAAAAAAMVGGAYAACEPEEIEVARVYQVQFNVYTTKGVAIGGIQTGSVCDPETSCVVMRGRDKTVLRGYIYICDNPCEVTDYAAAFADVRRYALFEDAAFEWDFVNVIGSKSTDAECAWTFTGTAAYNETQVQGYDLRGAGYATFNKSTEGFFDNFGGYFAGIASASYDLSQKDASKTDCVCAPSQVLKCDDTIEFVDQNTVAFGSWKMKYNANVTKAYLAGGETVFPQLLQKMFKK